MSRKLVVFVFALFVSSLIFFIHARQVMAQQCQCANWTCHESPCACDPVTKACGVCQVCTCGSVCPPSVSDPGYYVCNSPSGVCAIVQSGGNGAACPAQPSYGGPTVTWTPTSPTSGTVSWVNASWYNGVYGWGFPEQTGWQLNITTNLNDNSCYTSNGPGTNCPVFHVLIPDFANDPNTQVYDTGNVLAPGTLYYLQLVAQSPVAGCNYSYAAPVFTSCTPSLSGTLRLTPGVTQTISSPLGYTPTISWIGYSADPNYVSITQYPSIVDVQQEGLTCGVQGHFWGPQGGCFGTTAYQITASV